MMPTPFPPLPSLREESGVAGAGTHVSEPPAMPVSPPAGTPGGPFEPAAPPAAADFTDEDLQLAFAPLLEAAVRRAIFADESVLEGYFEPLLRATIRRALAEYSPAARPFHPPGAFDRLMWRMQALFTSRTYEDIIFEKTHRFQVQESYLLDVNNLSLISYASADPARHASPKRVAGAASRLAEQVRRSDGSVREYFELPDQRNCICMTGKFAILLTVVRGRPNEMILADLDFALRRIEDRFRSQFQQHGSPLLHALQPYLEDCLLIQSPAGNG